MADDESCRSRCRPKPTSITTSGWRGSRFVRLAASALLIVAAVLTSPADAQSCTNVTQTQTNCLPEASNSVTISCLTNYQLVIQSTAYYQTANNGTACTTSLTSTSAGVCNVLPNPASCPTATSSCNYIVPMPASSAGSCTGPFYLVTTYQCRPIFTTNANTTTAIATFMNNNATVSNSLVTIGNPAIPTGLFFYGPTDDRCSIYAPAGLELIIGIQPGVFTKTSGSGCGWRVQIDDITSASVASFCNASSPTVNLGCGLNPAAPRQYSLRYVGDSTVGIFFSIFFQVPQGNRLTVQCGRPPFPLNITDPTTPVAASTTPPGGASPTAGVTTPRAPLPTSAPSPGATSGAPTPAVTTGASNAGPTTSVFQTPPPMSTNLPPAATSGGAVMTTRMMPPSPAVTSGAPGPAGTSGLPNVAVTTLLPTPAPPTTPVPPAASATSLPPNQSGTSPVPPAASATSLPPNQSGTSPVTRTAVTTGSGGVVTGLSSTGSANAGSSSSSGVISSSPSTPSVPPSGSPNTGSSGGTSSPAPTPSTLATGVSSWDQNATIGLIVGGIVAAVLIGLIVAFVALRRRRRPEEEVVVQEEELKPDFDAVNYYGNDYVLTTNVIEPVRATNYQLGPRPYDSGPYRHVTGFYVDGNAKSNLVINRQQHQQPQQQAPFKTVLRLQ